MTPAKLPLTKADIHLGAKIMTVEEVIDTLAGFLRDDISGKRPMTVEARAVCATVLRMGEQRAKG